AGASAAHRRNPRRQPRFLWRARLPETGEEPVEERASRGLEDCASRNEYDNLRARAVGADDVQRGPDARRAFAHALQAEVAVLPGARNRRIDADAVVGDAQREILRVLQHDVETTAARMQARIANRLVAHPVHVIAHERMHLSRLTRDGQGDL